MPDHDDSSDFIDIENLSPENMTPEAIIALARLNDRDAQSMAKDYQWIYLDSLVQDYLHGYKFSPESIRFLILALQEIQSGATSSSVLFSTNVDRRRNEDILRKLEIAKRFMLAEGIRDSRRQAIEFEKIEKDFDIEVDSIPRMLRRKTSNGSVLRDLAIQFFEELSHLRSSRK